MSSATSLVFDLFGRDVSASKAIRDVAREAEHSSGSMAASFKKAATGVTLAGLAAVGESIHMAANFQQQMTRLVSAAGESESNLKMVSDGVLKIARDTGVSTNELAKGMYQVESAGFHGARGLAVMKAAAQGAQVEGANVESVANALTTVLDDMHAPASKAADVMSQMVAAVGQGKMTMDDLAGSIHSVLPNAASLGMTFAEVAGDLAEMTSQGMSADQSAQNLNHTIVKLAAPTQGMTKAMSMYGLTASDVAKNLGKKGLSGTLDELSLAILNKMGPAGTTLLNTFNTSKVAGQDLQVMLKSMPTTLRDLSQSFLDGKTSAKDFTLKLKSDFGGTEYALGRQFLSLVTSQRGFNEALKSGTPAAQTFQAAMKGMLGDQTGLQVALHLTGKASDDTASKIKLIGKAHADAAGNVAEFTMKEKNLNIEAAKMKEVVATAAITFGTKLIPMVSGSVTWLTKHAAIVEKVVIGLVALAVAVKTVEFAIRVVNAVTAVWTATTKAAALAQSGLSSMFLTTTAASESAAVRQAQAAAAFAEAEASKAAAVAEAQVEIAASLEGTDSVLAADSTAAAENSIEFADAQRAKAIAAQQAAAEITAAAEEAGASSSLALGPIGLAIGGVVLAGAGIMAMFGHVSHAAQQYSADEKAAMQAAKDQAQEHKQAVQEIGQAWDQDRYKLGQYTTAALANALNDSKASQQYRDKNDVIQGRQVSVLQMSQDLGLNTNLVAKAALDPKAKAQLVASIKARLAAAQQVTDEYQRQFQANYAGPTISPEALYAAQDEFANLSTLQKSLGLVGEEASTAAKKQDALAEAEGKAAFTTRDVATQFALYGKSIDKTTTDGRSNLEFIKEHIQALDKQKKGWDTGTISLYSQLTAMGLSSTAVVAQIALYGKVPLKLFTKLDADTKTPEDKIKVLQLEIDMIKQHKVPEVNTNTAAGRKVLADLQSEMNSLRQSRVPWITVNDRASYVLDGILRRVHSLQGAQIVAKVSETADLRTQKASGGLITGPGSGTSDSIPARLSNGEFVVKASQVGKNLRLLQAINAGHSFGDAVAIHAAAPATSYGARGGTVIQIEKLVEINGGVVGNGEQVSREVLKGLQRLKGSGVQVNLG